MPRKPKPPKDYAFPAKEAKNWNERIRWIRLATSYKDGTKMPITPEDFCDKAQIHPNTLSSAELGSVNTRIDTVLRIAKALAVPPALLFCPLPAFIQAVEKRGWTSQYQLPRTRLDLGSKSKQETEE